MANFSVTFIVKDWVSVDINAPDEETAKEKAQKIVNCGYKNTAIEIIDGKTEYVGISNNDLLEGLND